jgi:hypothetical protein
MANMWVSARTRVITYSQEDSMVTIHDPTLDTDAMLADFFLKRLAGLVSHQAMVTDPAERAVLARAAFSVFLDCLDLGLAAEARAIVEPARCAAALFQPVTISG